MEVWCDCFFFFFKQKTAYEIYQCDWSSDVCSSDLGVVLEVNLARVYCVVPDNAHDVERLLNLHGQVLLDRKSVV